MSIAQSYYKVKWTRGNETLKEIEFNDQNQNVLYRRQAALYEFFELKNDNYIKHSNDNKIEFIFFNHYVERDYDNGNQYDIDCAQKLVLFESVMNITTVDFNNWEIESNEYFKDSEFYFDEKVIVINRNGDAVVVLDNRICKELNIPFFELTDDDVYSLTDIKIKKHDREFLIDSISKNSGFKEEALERFNTETLRRAFHSGQGAYVYLNAVNFLNGLNK
jgi:hypothetical protein